MRFPSIDEARITIAAIIFQKSDLSTVLNIDKFWETNNVRVRRSVQENVFVTRSERIHGNDIC